MEARGSLGLPKIELRNVSKAFGGKQVLRGVNLTVQDGESLVIIGGSGSGKSVLLKCILGLMAPDSGEILVDGQKVNGLSTRAREELMKRFGMLFQGGALFDSLRVWQNVSFRQLYNEGMAQEKAKARAISKLEQVGLGAREAELFPAELSGGMQKRVSLARAICSDPEIIFFDEPTTGLDPIMADVINDLIIDASKKLGSTALTITHDMASAVKIADRIAMLFEGAIIWEGAAKTIYHSGHAHVDQFVHGRAIGPIATVRG